MHVLITPRLTLRPPAYADAEDIALWLSDTAVTHNLAAVPYPYTPDDAVRWIDEIRNSPQDLVYTIHRERLIGVVSIENVEDDPRLGYWLAARHHGHGFMTEAARRLIGHAVAERSIGSIRSSVFVDNPASLAVQRKLGFSVTGRGEMFSRSRNETVPTLKTALAAEAFAAAADLEHMAAA